VEKKKSTGWLMNPSGPYVKSMRGPQARWWTKVMLRPACHDGSRPVVGARSTGIQLATVHTTAMPTPWTVDERSAVRQATSGRREVHGRARRRLSGVSSGGVALAVMVAGSLLGQSLGP